MSIERNDLDNYFMKPQFLEGVGNIYPISIFNYESFSKLAGKYITQGITTLHNLYKVNKKTNELDYFIEKGIKMDKEISYLNNIKQYIPINEDEQSKYNELMQLLNLYNSGQVMTYSIYELEELFSLLLKKQVRFKCSDIEEELNYVFQVENNDLYITRDNFKEFRDIVLWQNILYEMPTSKDKKINEAIETSLRSQSKNNKSGDLCAMLSVVGTERGLSDEEIFKYTFYRLRFDYEIITRKYYNIFMFMLRSQGCESATILELSEEVNLRINPYNMLVGDFKTNSLDKSLQQK